MADADAFSPLANGAIEHFRSRAVGELGQEVVLDGPEAVPADFIGQLHLRQDLLVSLELFALVPGFGHLDLVEQVKLHKASLPVIEDDTHMSKASPCHPAAIYRYRQSGHKG